MSKQSLLLVDGDTRSLRVLEVSLRKAGFTVTPASTVKDALDTLELHTPDLIIAETSFSADLDGFELRRRVRGTPDWAQIPFVFLTAETAIEHKIRGLELGVDDYLTKPIYIKEIVTRINILLQKKQRASLEERKDGVRFAGRVADMPVVDVIQTIEVSRKSGVIQFTGGHGRQAAIYFRDGKVIDAEAGTLQGEDAVYRLLTWNDGDFEVVFRTVRRREAISTSSQGLLMEGMRRLDEWSRLLEQLPPLSHRFEVDAEELAGRLGEVPDDNNKILRLFDGKRTLFEVIDGSDFGDLECLQAVSRLYFEGLLLDLEPEQRKRRDTGRSAPANGAKPSPIEEVISGPIAVASLPDAPSAPIAASARAVRERAQTSEPVPASASAAAAPEPGRASSAPAGGATLDGGADATASIADLDDPRDAAEHVADDQVQSAEDASLPGPLSGGYRPSSLRLIDEAVAAAQLIEPSLFADDPPSAGAPPASAGFEEAARSPLATESALDASEPLALEPAPSATEPAPASGPPVVARLKLATRTSDARLAAARDLVERNRTAESASAAEPAAEPPRPDSEAIPTAIDGDEAINDPPTDPSRRKYQSPHRSAPIVLRRDESGLRMIGSLGADRAEASGELVPPPDRESDGIGAPGRELVTIMPRKNTREIPIIAATAATEAEPATADAAGESSASDADATTSADAATTGVPARRALPPTRPPVAGGVFRRTGPGAAAIALFGIAALLAGMASYLYLHKRHTDRAVVGAPADAAVAGRVPDRIVDAAIDAGTVALVRPDAGAARPAHADATAVALVRPDAGLVQPVPTDAPAVAVAHVDAAVVRPPPVDAATSIATATHDAGEAAVDRVKDARDLLEKAHAALEDNDPDKALALADASLKLRRTARTYLERARALQRLGRIDEALASVDEAMTIVSDYAPAWEQRAMLLWSARRYDEARPALEKYIALDPNGKSAAAFRRMLDEHP